MRFKNPICEDFRRLLYFAAAANLEAAMNEQCNMLASDLFSILLYRGLVGRIYERIHVPLKIGVINEFKKST